MSIKHDVTQLLEQAADGNKESVNLLFGIVYEELKRLAIGQLAGERANHTLQSTALVHEVWIKLVGKRDNATWKNRDHFFAAAAQAMRRILVDSARARLRKKRGGDQERVELRDEDVFVDEDDQLIALDEALKLLRESDPEKAKLVELKYFAGLTNSETATLMQISTSTVERHWAFARAWLRARMEK